MSVPQEEGLVRAWAYALALAVLLHPVCSPDLFWHLNAGRWIAAHFAAPRVDQFSFTAYGQKWIDFEWGLQLVWYAVDRVAGLWGLWAFKAAMVVAAFLPVEGLLREKDVSPSARAGALGLWLAAMLPQTDLRADLVSSFFLAVLLRRLAQGRASFLFGLGLFALWANLHAGFVLGFALYALAAVVARLEGRSAPQGLAGEATGAVLGSLLNPYGLGLYGVLGSHASAPMARFVLEWGPPSWHRAYQIPLLAALAVVFAVAAAAPRRARGFLGLGALAFAAATCVSARFASYFGPAAALFVFTSFPRPRREFVVGGLGLLTILFYGPIQDSGRGQPYNDIYVARRAADFVARERAVFAPLRTFNQYEWGGYLGWRLGPEGRVFGDGRYLFHDQLSETQAALDSPEALSDFARRERLGAFLIRDYPQTIASTRLYPDGSSRGFARPWHISFFPRERWALVWFDEQALIFVDRAKAPSAWLAAHEYRWRRPGDESALADALSRGEVPRAALAVEDARHAVEVPQRAAR